MKKLTPELREQIRRNREWGEAARRNMQEVIDRIDARRRAEEERRARRRSLLLRLVGRS